MSVFRVSLTVACLVVLPVCLTVLAENPDAALPAQARDVLQKNCYRCHGIRFEVADFNVLDRASLTAHRDKDGKSYIVPGKPDESILWHHVAIARDMPPVEPKLSEAEQSLLKRWIIAGAELPGIEPGPRPLVSEKAVLGSIRDDLRRARESDRRFLRYFTIHNLFNNQGVSDVDLRLARAALSKAINSLSRIDRIVVPRSIDPEQTVFCLDLRDVGWDDRDVWTEVLRQYPYGLTHDGDRDEEVRTVSNEISRMTVVRLPYLRADWFVVTATRPPLYNKILELPETTEELESQLKVDIKNAFHHDKLKRGGVTASGVSVQNRILERHFGSATYWKSYDFNRSEGTSNIFQYPLGPVFAKNPFPEHAFEQAGGEAIFSLPNGLPAYYLANAKGQSINQAPFEIVSDTWKTAGSPVVVAGISCMGCHQNGIRRFDDSVRRGASVAGDARDKVTRLYLAKDEMDRVLAGDEERFNRAIAAAIRPFLSPGELEGQKNGKTTEPIRGVALLYQNELDTKTVAAELGLADPAKLMDMLKASRRLRSLGLEPLLSGARIKRSVWSTRENKSISTFQETAQEFDLGTPTKVF